MSPAPHSFGDRRASELVSVMAAHLFSGALRDQVDLGDERSVDLFLAGIGYRRGYVADFDNQVGRALEEARAKWQRRLAIADLLDKGADVIALAAIITMWSLIYCLVCPPANAAVGAPLTDVSLSFAAVLLPFLIAVLLVMVLVWHDRGLRMPMPEEEPPRFDAPPTAPVLASLEQQLREADGA